ncbi:DUF2213 domain-containing protein [Tropicimonas sp. IMCC34011]|uniref:DUF2213 domain-containing protein n=1 Tax=Tropicimonas sp. IMCC34011 TaxID=2248759 RepID=UPI000E27A597|nr:DUF2213 domain-containing protein [Tropicimonas sp. IMCC34011]
MQIKDSLTLDASGLSRSRDGYLVAEARVSRAGNVQQYYGAEIGLTGDDAGRVFGVYRDPDVVFDEASMSSLAGRPVTRGHPPEGVSAKTWKDLAVGAVGGRVVRDGEHVVASMAIMDEAAAVEVERGARALSAGYTVGITKDEGLAPGGEAYQYRQTGPLRFNHVAYLPDNNPRAGNTRIGDAARNWGLDPIITNDRKDDDMAEANRTVLIDGLSVVTTDAGAQALEKLQGTIADKDKALTDAQAAHDAALATKDAELAKKDGEIADLKKQVLSDADLDKRVQDRAALIDTARKIAPKVEVSGLSDAEIRKAAVEAVRGADSMKDKSEAYIAAAFDFAAEAAGKGPDTLRDAAAGGVKINTTDAWGFLDEKKEA